MADADVLFAEHRQGVFRYLCRIVGQTETARDLTQEVFLRVSRTRVPDADPASLRAWVFRIARNLALNHLRDGHRRPHLVAAVDRAEPAVQELAAALNEAVASLSEVDRDVFLLRETAGLNYEEIAATCGLTVEAVRARLHRARQQLRVALEGPLLVHRRRPVSFGEGER
ncbi:MAG TPA: RNA polymerase sigma factor [Vicinamibacterales bacterium]|nr:RNA polymerase sigma factor [Vicinamibacterales bacterium]